MRAVSILVPVMTVCWLKGRHVNAWNKTVLDVNRVDLHQNFCLWCNFLWQQEQFRRYLDHLDRKFVRLNRLIYHSWSLFYVEIFNKPTLVCNSVASQVLCTVPKCYLGLWNHQNFLHWAHTGNYWTTNQASSTTIRDHCRFDLPSATGMELYPTKGHMEHIQYNACTFACLHSKLVL